MLINLTETLSKAHEPIEKSMIPVMEKVSLASGEFSITDKELFHIKVSHIKEKQLLIEGAARLGVLMPCDRCLKVVTEPFDLQFVKHVDLGDHTNNELDETNYIDGYYLDTEQLLYNEIIVGWPMKILCCDDCKGICNVCGQNLNEGTCNCKSTNLDPRMSVVQDVFKNFKEV